MPTVVEPRLSEVVLVTIERASNCQFVLKPALEPMFWKKLLLPVFAKTEPSVPINRPTALPVESAGDSPFVQR